MASCNKRGTAYFDWDLGTFLLAVPLSPVNEIMPSVLRSRYDWWSEDLENRSTTVIGRGVREIVAAIRMDDQPAQLMTMLRRAEDEDLTLTYYPVSGGTAFPLRVVEVVGGDVRNLPIQGDRDRYGAGEWEVRVRFRRTDGGVLDGIYA